MRLSQFYFYSLKENPQEAELISHQLMLRSNMIKQTASGIYSWLPLGLRVLRKIENIVREEMDASGAIELSMPMTQPAELWQESNRWQDYGAELLRLHDRHQRQFCLGPTHEEVIADIFRRDIQSYRQLPVNLYQIQTKFRDEVRPRFGVMRSREFLMKDAYSFHTKQSCLQKTYDIMVETYTKIFTRLGLEFRAVSADSGSIGGNFSHEFHVLADSGEDGLAFSDGSSYCANVELAESICTQDRETSSEAMQSIETPNCKTINDVATLLQLPVEKCVKTLLVEGVNHPAIAVVLRGDHELNEIKAEKHPLIKTPLNFVDESVAVEVLGANFGSLGPVHMKIPVLVDRYAAVITDFCCGANQNDQHFVNVNWGRDLEEPQVVDMRTVIDGDPSPDGLGKLQIKRGIEVGHVFQLGTKYSQKMGVIIQDENGKSLTPLMGCYGIGISRIVAATIEQNYDEQGVFWPESIAPFLVEVILINSQNSPSVEQFAQKIEGYCRKHNIEVLIDDRDLRLGNKFADADLIGCPHRLIVGEKSLAKGEIEYQNRRSLEKEFIDINGWQNKLKSLSNNEH